MGPTLPNNLLHNPFNNRFNDPVSRRHDDMQADAYMVWLRERNQGLDRSRVSPEKSSSSETFGGRIVAGTFALFFLLVSAAVLFRVV